MGLLLKTIRETWLHTMLVAAGLFGVNILLTLLIPKVQAGFGEAMDKLPFAKQMIAALLGTEVGNQIAAETMAAVLWVHPIVLALVWFHAINLSTRVPAGEVDRGTIDFLLGLPVSRRKVYWCEVATILASGILLLMSGFAGHRLVASAMPLAWRPNASTAMVIMANLYCLYMAVAGIGLLTSTLSNRRGWAMGIVFALVLASFLLNFAAQVWAPAKSIAMLGILEYYRPALILQTGKWPLDDLAVLVAIAGISIIAGSEVMARRSLCAN